MNIKYNLFFFIKYFSIFLFCLLKTTGLFSQENGAIYITLHAKDVSPLFIFKTIESQCNYHFIYDEQGIDSLHYSVTLDFDDENLYNVFNALKKRTNLKFRVYDHNIAVAIKEKKVTINGFVTDSVTGENLIGAVVFISGTNIGTTTNSAGYYSLNIPIEKVHVISRFLGYDSKQKEINGCCDNNLNFSLLSHKNLLKEVLVSTTNLQDSINDNVEGVNTISVKDISFLPMTYSEPDFVKSTCYLPGVSRLNYGSTGYSVRGSSVGDNMVLLDNYPLYNISHRIADLSIFNPDIIQDVQMYKNGIPAKYEGATSVLNVTSRNGDNRQFHVKGGVGLISTRLSFEGPILKDKVSFLLSCRRSNMEWYKMFDSDINTYYFFDLNAKIHCKINDRNHFSLSAYNGGDKVVYRSEEQSPGQSWSNLSLGINWNSILNSRLMMSSVIYYSSYDYCWIEDAYIYNGSFLDGGINVCGVKQNYIWNKSSKSKVNFGWNFNSNHYGTEDEATDEDDYKDNWAIAPGISVFMDVNTKISQKIVFAYGLRWNYYMKGHFGQLNSLSSGYIISTNDATYSSDLLQTMNVQPRLALSYKISSKSKFKLSYNHTNQYLHQVSYLGSSNSTYFVWVPSTSDIKPIIGDQISLGYYHNTAISGFSYSAEAFVKNSKNNISYFTDSLTSETTLSLQNELLSSKGKSYGLEFYAAVTKEKLTGHISYTLSRSLRQADEINNGSWYSSNYDRPQNVALNLNYKLSPNFRLNVSWLYSTGMPSSVSYDELKNDNVEFDIDNINTYRLPDYHRLDLGLVYENKSKPLRRFHSTWSFNIYNVYNRDNNYIHEGINQSSIASYNNTSLCSDYGIMPAISYRLNFDFNGNSCFSRFIGRVEKKINELFPPLDD